MLGNEARGRCFSLFLAEGVQGLRVAETDRYDINTDDSQGESISYKGLCLFSEHLSLNSRNFILFISFPPFSPFFSPSEKKSPCDLIIFRSCCFEKDAKKSHGLHSHT